MQTSWLLSPNSASAINKKVVPAEESQPLSAAKPKSVMAKQVQDLRCGQSFLMHWA